MWCRCKICNNVIDFRNRRGNKLSMSNCKCGGSYERMSDTVVFGKNPFEPAKVYLMHFGENKGKEYFPAVKNTKGALFYHDRVNKKLIPLLTNGQNPEERTGSTSE